MHRTGLPGSGVGCELVDGVACVRAEDVRGSGRSFSPGRVMEQGYVSGTPEGE